MKHHLLQQDPEVGSQQGGQHQPDGRIRCDSPGKQVPPQQWQQAEPAGKKADGGRLQGRQGAADQRLTGQECSRQPADHGNQGQEQAVTALAWGWILAGLLGHQCDGPRHQHGTDPGLDRHALAHQHHTADAGQHGSTGFHGECAACAQSSQGTEIEAIASGDTDHTAEQQQRHGSTLLQPGNAQQHRQKHEGGQAVFPAVELAGSSQCTERPPQCTGAGPGHRGAEGCSQSGHAGVCTIRKSGVVLPLMRGTIA